MDDVDITTDRLEQELARRLAEEANKAHEIPDGPGHCLACDDPVEYSALDGKTPRWCCAACRDRWEQLMRAQRQNRV